MQPRRRGRIQRKVAERAEIAGQRIPIDVRRPTIQISRETGANFELEDIGGGTQRLVVGNEAGGETRGPESERHRQLNEWARHGADKFKSPEYWSLFTDFEKRQQRAWWEHMVPKESREKSLDYWRFVPWEEKALNPAFKAVEAARTEKQRSGLQRKAFDDKLKARLKEKSDIEKELKKPWHSRKRNSIRLRAIQLGLDLVALPFSAAGWVLQLPARPISWINDKIFGRVGYTEKETGEQRTLLRKGVTGKELLLPSVFEERKRLRELNKK